MDKILRAIKLAIEFYDKLKENFRKRLPSKTPEKK